MPAAPTPMQPTDLRDRRARGEAIVILDVRQPEEVEICRIEGAVHIPMGEIPKRFGELDAKAKTVVYCHHGMRSFQVGSFLLQNGFADVSNLNGGIDGWAAAVEPEMARY